MLNRMVKYSDDTLDRTFAALADPTRRALVARLGSRETFSVSELAQPFGGLGELEDDQVGLHAGEVEPDAVHLGKAFRQESIAN